MGHRSFGIWAAETPARFRIDDEHDADRREYR
jgi:rRNA maturation protein Nop10